MGLAMSFGIDDDAKTPSASLGQGVRRVATPAAAATIASLFAAQISLAADGTATASTSSAPPAPVKKELGPPPADSDYGIKGEFYSDCTRLVQHMRYAVQMEKGTPGIASIAQRTKDEMGDFVSYYRRFNGITGKQTYSLLYTSINVLSGHYTSYGTKFPVPEKRRKRLMQEFNDIEKNIRKKR